MSRTSKLHIDMGNGKTITIHGVANDVALKTVKAIVIGYRQWVILMAEDGKLYSPQVIGKGFRDASFGHPFHQSLFRALAKLGLADANEVEKAIAAAGEKERRREVKRTINAARCEFNNRGLKIPVSVEKWMNKVIEQNGEVR